MGLGATPALVAIAVAMATTALIWVPASIVTLRRRGRFGWGTALLSFAGLVYACGLIAYTLFPTGACYAPFTAQLVPGAFVGDVLDSGGVALSNPALRQVLLNVLLFVPFGMLVRRPRRRRVLATTLLGVATSVVIEVAQLTGTFGLAACQYRLLDVDDVLLNGVGALAGAFAAPLVWRVPGQPDTRQRTLPRPLTAGRRLGAMAIDVGVSIGVGGAVMVLGIGGVGLVVLLASGSEREAPVALVSAIGVVVGASGAIAAAIVHLLVVLRTGRTIGELAGWLDTRVQRAPDDDADGVDDAPVEVPRRRGRGAGTQEATGRPQTAWEADSTQERASRADSARSADPMPGIGRRLARWALGIGGWTLLSGLALDSGSQALAGLWALVAVVLAFRSRAHSGLALRLTRQVARDARDPR